MGNLFTLCEILCTQWVDVCQCVSIEFIIPIFYTCFPSRLIMRFDFSFYSCVFFYDQRFETEVKDSIAARKVQKADREKLRRDRLNEQFADLGNALGKPTSQLHAMLKWQQWFFIIIIISILYRLPWTWNTMIFGVVCCQQFCMFGFNRQQDSLHVQVQISSNIAKEGW